MASNEECDTVDAKATAEEAKFNSVEETKSERESNGIMKVYLTEQKKKMILRRLDLLIVSCAELVERKPRQ